MIYINYLNDIKQNRYWVFLCKRPSLAYCNYIENVGNILGIIASRLKLLDRIIRPESDS